MISISSHIKMFKSHVSRGIHHKRAPLKNSILENVIFLGAADRAQVVKQRPSLLSVGAAVHRAHCQCKQAQLLGAPFPRLFALCSSVLSSASDSTTNLTVQAC